MNNIDVMTKAASDTGHREIAVLDSVNLTFRTDGIENRVLDNFSLTCASGEFVVLLGRSGCGKTTVLNLLAGLVDPDEGHIDVAGQTPRKARRSLGYMFARDALVPSRTALANVEIGLEVRGARKAERRRIAMDLLGKLGLEGAEKKYPWQLSQGMRQRVALARTWALTPDLILMDEPFAALDAQTRESVRAQFLDIWEKSGSGVIFVTHDLTEALLLGDRVVVMGEGGRFLGDYRLPFDRPRNAGELPFTPEFRSLEREMHGLLHEGAFSGSDQS